MRRVFKLTRRNLLIAGAAGIAAAGGGGLWLVVQRRASARWARAVRRAQPFTPSVYLAIDRAGTTTIWLVRSEMGQGVGTALPMLLAEELDADWQKVRVEQAVLDGAYDYGPMMTSGSGSVRSQWWDMRRAGAAARAMLVRAAARRWDVGVETCTTSAGHVTHAGSGRKLGYGELSDAAAQERVPFRLELKSPAQFRLLGRPVARLDLPAKVTGQARYGLDVRVPGQAWAVLARCPTQGGKLKGANEAQALAVSGVEAVFHVKQGVAVVANSTWAALEGRRALETQWDPGPNADWSTARVRSTLDSLLVREGAVVRDEHDALSKLATKGRVIEARYAFPFLAHAAMEPLNVTVRLTGDRCELWAPTQHPDGVRATAAEVLKLTPEKITVHTTFMGGGFGRRTNPDEVAEAVEVARQAGKPIQLVYDREDDLRHDRYREASSHLLRAALDAGGTPTAWFHRFASPSILGKQSARGEFDEIATYGARDVAYDLGAVRVEWLSAELPVPVGIWRAVGYSYNTFAVESFIDELAHAASQDPLPFRRKLLQQQPRLLRCVEHVAERARWGTPTGPGRARGMAVLSGFGSFIAQVAEVSWDGSQPTVTQLWCAVDCGIVVNPDTVLAQIEGGIAFGLSAALFGKIDLEQGAVSARNFHEYRLLRMSEMPPIDVSILPSEESPGGVGELAVPCVAPAVANAVFAASGRRIRELPFVRV